jgi:hypothetical protein
VNVGVGWLGPLVRVAAVVGVAANTPLSSPMLLQARLAARSSVVAMASLVRNGECMGGSLLFFVLSRLAL